MKLPFHNRKFVLLACAVALAVALETLSVAGIKVPAPYAFYIYAAFVLGTGYHVLWGGLKSLFRLNFSSINLLMLIAVCAAFYLGEYPEAAVVIVLYVLGEKLEDIGMEQSMSELDKLVRNAPETATIKSTGMLVPVDRVDVGTVIRVKPHDLIPLDGIIETGESTVDESSITGEPVPKEKNTGDTVFAGTMNQRGFLEIKTTKPANGTTFAKIIALTYEAQANKSDAQKYIQRFAKIYTPVIIVLSVLLFLIPVFVLGQDLTRWLHQAVSLLVISCPCALVISTPVAIYAAIGNASSKGALIKGGKYLEALAGIGAIALDKTRTITYGRPVVSDLVPLNGADRKELLSCSAGTEVFSEHPLAQSIVDAARKEGFEPHLVRQFESMAGKGAKAVCLVCDEKPVLVGKLNFIEQHQPVGEEVRAIVEQFSEQGKTSVVISCNHEIKGVIALTDEVKPDSGKSIDRIRSLGIAPVMVSGDSKKAAEHVAAQVGIKMVYGELLPQDKAAVVGGLMQRHQSVAMVGDGINDAPAMAASTVGIAMGAAGSDTAIEVANIALMNDRLSLIPFLVRLSRKTVSTIKGNTIGAIAVKIFFILLAFFGFSNLVLAITADVGVTIVVILISLRLMNVKDET